MFIEEIKEKAKSKRVIIYSDMDGVLAEYRTGEKPSILGNEKEFFLRKRAIFSTINKLEALSKLENIEIGIMSNCYFQEQKKDKIVWLEKYCPFIKKENINIIVLNEEPHTKETKNYLKVNKILALNEGKDVECYLVEDNYDIISASNKTRHGIAHHLSEILD